jgi:transcriptional regulator with XRE-family HTH domain
VRREKIAPSEYGLVAAGRRRSRGLTREDAAQLAGVSFKWYSLFESGHANGVSRKFVDRVSAVLRLTHAERDHLFALLGLGNAHSAETPILVPPRLQQLADAQRDMPAAIYSNIFDVLYANALYRRIFERKPARAPRRRNKIWKIFLDPETRRRWRNWRSVAQQVVREFRYLNGADPQSPQFQQLFSELQTDPDFRRLWNEADVDTLDAAKEHFEFDVPAVGTLVFDAIPMTIPDNSRLFFVVLMPGNEASVKAMRRLSGRRPATKRGRS